MKQENGIRYYQVLGQKLKELMVSGNYPVGSRLMPEREIAQFYNVSRATVREALIMLEIEGLIAIKKGSGAYVLRHPTPTDYKDTLMRKGDHGPFEVLQARQILESNIAAFAALTITKNDIAEMREILKSERRAVESGLDISEENDKCFHSVIARSTQNGMLSDVLEQLWDARVNSPMWDQLHAHIEDKAFRIKWLDDHEVILNALQKRDAALSRKAMWQHLENVKNTLMTLSDFDDPNFDGYLFESVSYKVLFEP